VNIAPNTAERLSYACALLRLWGVPVVERTGWRTKQARTDITFAPAGIINHHTAGNGTSDAMLFDDGNGYVKGPLCHFAVQRDAVGTVTLGAAGYANHAGMNDKPSVEAVLLGPSLSAEISPGADDSYSANRCTLGIEVKAATTMTAAQYASTVALNAALVLAFGWSKDRPPVGSHKEITRRKPADPAEDMAKLRRDVVAFIAAKSAPVVTPPPATPAARTLSVKLLSTNARIDTAPDTGRFRWLYRRAAYLALLRRIAPSLILFQELNDSPQGRYISMQQYVFGKLTHLAKSCPSKGNRPIGYDKTKWTLRAEKAVELSPNSWAHVAQVERDGFRLWLVNVHLSTSADVRPGQLRKLAATVAGLSGAVVVAGDFNQPTVSLPGFRDAFAVAAKVTNRTARTLHGWREQRWDGKHIDHVLVRDGDTTKISVRYLDVILTSAADETDHNALACGLTLTAKPSDL